MCQFLLVHVHYINMHLPFFFDVVCTQLQYFPTNYDNNVVKTLLRMSILVPSVVSVSGLPTLIYTNVSITIVHILIQRCIVYQQMMRICCEIVTFYSCTYISVSPLVNYRNMHLPIVLCCGKERELLIQLIIITLVSIH